MHFVFCSWSIFPGRAKEEKVEGIHTVLITRAYRDDPVNTARQ